MCDSTVVKELPETSFLHGAICDDDVALVRQRHAEKVEEWLDFADFATELFKLHEKYGIEKGEEGYAAYRKYLRTSYYQELQTNGPTPDPLDEGCDCIFCRMHSEEPPAETENEVNEETVVHTTASGERELPVATSKLQWTQVPRSPVVNQEPAEPDSKKLGPVPAYNCSEQRPVETEVCRVRCADRTDEKFHRVDGPHSGPYVANVDSVFSRGDTDRQEERRRRKKRYGPDWVSGEPAGEFASQKMPFRDRSHQRKLASAPCVDKVAVAGEYAFGGDDFVRGHPTE